MVFNLGAFFARKTMQSVLGFSQAALWCHPLHRSHTGEQINKFFCRCIHGKRPDSREVSDWCCRACGGARYEMACFHAVCADGLLTVDQIHYLNVLWGRCESLTTHVFWELYLLCVDVVMVSCRAVCAIGLVAAVSIPLNILNRDCCVLSVTCVL